MPAPLQPRNAPPAPGGVSPHTGKARMRMACIMLPNTLHKNNLSNHTGNRRYAPQEPRNAAEEKTPPAAVGT